ncbi:MAG: hypothetical protein ABIO16_00885 [Nocardioides sp.]
MSAPTCLSPKRSTTSSASSGAELSVSTARQALVLVGGCLVLGTGVAMLLTADLGSDGWSTMVNGVALSLGVSFWVVNAAVGLVFVAMAWWRGVRPGPGTVTQVLLVGVTVSVLLDAWDTPSGWPGRIVLLVLAFPVLAAGIAAYLGSNTGAGPTEAAALAWDPPIPFRWSYTAVQGGGALIGWLLGATVGLGTVAVIVVLGPLVDLASRLMRLDLHQTR